MAGLALVLVGGCSWVNAGDSPDEVVGKQGDDVAEAIVAELGGRVEVTDSVVIEECENSGSGPLGPASRRSLRLADGTTADDVVAVATQVLERSGFVLERPTSGGNPQIENVLAARRSGEVWDATVAIQSAPSSETAEVMVWTSVDPQPECESPYD